MCYKYHIHKLFFYIFTSRHILAYLHFNENVHRQTRMSKSGTPYIRVTYPKFKLGEEMVREVAVPATYGMHTPIKVLLQGTQSLMKH